MNNNFTLCKRGAMASISDANVTSVTATDGRYVIFTDVTKDLGRKSMFPA